MPSHLQRQQSSGQCCVKDPNAESWDYGTVSSTWFIFLPPTTGPTNREKWTINIRLGKIGLVEKTWGSSYNFRFNGFDLLRYSLSTLLFVYLNWTFSRIELFGPFEWIFSSDFFQVLRKAWPSGLGRLGTGDWGSKATLGSPVWRRVAELVFRPLLCPNRFWRKHKEMLWCQMAKRTCLSVVVFSEGKSLFLYIYFARTMLRSRIGAWTKFHKWTSKVTELNCFAI